MKIKFLLSILLLITTIGFAQTNVTTVTGSSLGDVLGPPGTAQFYGPYGIANNGTSVITEFFTHKLKKILNDNNTILLAGDGMPGFVNGSGAAARFNQPAGMAKTTTNDFLVADSGNHAIRKVTDAGVVTTIAGTGVSGFVDGNIATARFNSPYGVVENPANGDIYIADTFNHRIRKISGSTVSTFAGDGVRGYIDGTGTSARFDNPYALVFDSSGNLFVSDGARIRKITPAGVVTTFAGGSTAGFLDGTGTAARFGIFNSGLAIDSSNNLYLADIQNARIRKITPAGVVTTHAGTGTFGNTDGPGTVATFNGSSGLAIRVGTTTLDVVDFNSNRIRRVTEGVPPTAPAITAISITNITTNSATVNYTLNANNGATTSVINYGTSSGSLTSSVSGFGANGNAATAGNAQLTALSPNTQYFYRISATNSAGTTQSAVGNFTTNSLITPTFAAIAPICSGASLAPLPTTSTNGVTGTWSPALNNTATTTYTFTPAAGQCATTRTLVITVNPPVTPNFNAVAPICSGASLAALPTTSTNGVTGTWSPALNNTTTTTYTFTPAAGQCATTRTLVITVNPPVTPNFNAVAPICSGASLAALPTTSTNGVTGTWSPALNNTATTTYTFTPAAGQCATTRTLVITVNPPVTPNFNAVAPICSGASLAPLPTTSTNGVTGTWSPALNNTATTTYTFTPAAGQCATTRTLVITVNPNVTPNFNAVAPICSGASLAALPTTSTNGVTGTWSPALNNTTTTTYTFTPAAGQCATTRTLVITVNPNVTPNFNAVAPICSGASLAALPTTSTNGVTGTWSPALNNTATTTYTFTPAAGQCATTRTLVITVNPPVTPNFNAVAPICSGASLAALPTTSTNGVTGTWSPALNNTATTTYTFTPAAGQCATTRTLVITVNPPVTPNFNAVAPICSGATLAPLPTTSTNGVTGTWSPALNNTATTTYTFTPAAGQCATTRTLVITVNTAPVPTGSANQSFAPGSTLASIVVNATATSWFASSANALNNVNELPASTVLVNGATYFAINTVNGCRSLPFAVTITVTLSLNESAAFKYTIYPNPVKEVLHIETNQLIKQVVIFNLQGQKVFTTTDKQINVTSLPTGVYLLRVEDVNGAFVTDRFIKQAL